MRIPAVCLGLIAGGAALALLTRPADDPRGVTVAVWGSQEEVTEFRRLVAEPVRAELDDVPLEVVYVPSDYYVKLATLMAAGEAPDLFWLDQDHVPMFADLGALLDLGPFVERDDDPVVALDDYYPQIMEAYRHDGKLIGLPWIAQPVVLYVNTRLFNEAGVDLPSGDWRWDDMVAAGKRLTRDTTDDGEMDHWGLAIDVGWPPLVMFVWQNDGILIGPNGRLGLSEPAALAAAEFWRGLIHRHRVAPPLSKIPETGVAALFRQEKTAMYFGGAADREDRVQDPRDPTRQLPVRVFEVPAGPNGTPCTFAWHAGLHISSTTKDPRRAYRVFKLLLGRIQRWKIPAPRKSLAGRLEEFEPRKADAADVIRRSMAHMRPLRPIPRLTDWQERFHESFLEPVLTGQADPAEAARRAAPRLREVMPK